jgi:hypothetical protein
MPPPEPAPLLPFTLPRSSSEAMYEALSDGFSGRQHFGASLRRGKLHRDAAGQHGGQQSLRRGNRQHLGRIAQQLYQNSSIAVNGFEKVQMPDSFFDVAVGNVPFGDFKVLDKKYDKHHWLIHDYFFGKTLDKVRPGGIVAFITSKGHDGQGKLRCPQVSGAAGRPDRGHPSAGQCLQAAMPVPKSPATLSFCKSATA